MIRRGVLPTGARWCSSKAQQQPSPTWVANKSDAWEAAASETHDRQTKRDVSPVSSISGMAKVARAQEESKILHDGRLKMREGFADPWMDALPTEKAVKPREDIPTDRKVNLDLPEPEIASEVEEEVADLTDDYLNTDNELADISGAYKTENDWQFIITEDNYSMIEQDTIPWVLDCWAPQNEDSIAMSLTLRLLVKKVNDAAGRVIIKLGRMDCNLNYGLTLHLGVNTLPTALAVHGSEMLEQQTGMVDEEGMAQFIFGYASTIYGEEILSSLTEDDPVCSVIDARIAVKNKDYQTALMKYSEVYKASMKKVEAERNHRREQADKGNFTPEATRELTDAEVLAGKSAAGLALTLFHMGKVRHSRKMVKALPDDLPKVYATMSDVRKTIASIEIMRLTGYKEGDDLEDLEDEERIDQHNLDVKMKLIGSYFMSGDYAKTLSACFLMIRKNRRYRDGAPKLVLCRVMQYMGRHHPVREEFEPVFNKLLLIPTRRTSHINQKLSIAIGEPANKGSAPLAHEIPLMVDRNPFRNEDNHSRHPLLR